MLVFSFFGTKADLGKVEQALYGLHGGRCMLGTLENVEETKNECRRHWEVGTKGRELGEGQSLHPVHGETIEHDFAKEIISTSPSTPSTLSVLL